MTHKHRLIVVYFSAYMLNACQTAPQKNVEKPVETSANDSDLVKEFNQEGNKYMDNAKQLQADINAYNSQVNKSNQESNAYNTNCNNRAYKSSDLNQLAQNLIDVMQNNSELLDAPIFENTSSGIESANTNSSGNNSTIHLPGSARK